MTEEESTELAWHERLERRWGPRWPDLLSTAGVIVTVLVSLVIVTFEIRSAADLQSETTQSAAALQAEALAQDRDLETRSLRRDLYGRAAHADRSLLAVVPRRAAVNSVRPSRPREQDVDGREPGDERPASRLHHDVSKRRGQGRRTD